MANDGISGATAAAPASRCRSTGAPCGHLHGHYVGGGSRKLLEAEGYDESNGDIAIIRLIAVPVGQKPNSEPPRVLSV
jgi:hypothetical protein